MIPMTQERELTLAEVAAAIGVSSETARGILQREEIPSRKQGRQWRVSEADVAEYIRKSREKRNRGE